jgi:hypothetical protein
MTYERLNFFIKYLIISPAFVVLSTSISFFSIKLFPTDRGINSRVPNLLTCNIRGGWCVEYSGRNKHNMRTFLHYITGRRTRPVLYTLCPFLPEYSTHHPPLILHVSKLGTRELIPLSVGNNLIGSLLYRCICNSQKNHELPNIHSLGGFQ